ncbi:MAG: choice-of-anchor J domain-containing protein, partial [Schleiferiaceae bacterium]|nr:choice-of-anchor J domain-containing protein [Schleiferiaceae bacterium]
MRKRLQKTLRHAWSASLILLSLSFLPFSAQSQCDYKIVGYDSWGDGWNGASIDVDVAGTVTNFTLTNGSIDSTSISSFNGDFTTFTFNSGSFDSEVTFDIYAPDGSLLGSYGPSPSTGLFLTDNSNATCTPPCDYKIVGYDSFGDGWNGASIDVDVAGAVTNFTLANGSIDSISITSYSGDITTFTFNSGTFDSEITFDVYAPDGTLLGSYGPSPAAGLFLTDTSNSVCTAPSCLAPLGLTLNNLGIDSASISWSAAGATPTNGFDYQLVPGGNGIGVGVVASGNSSSASQVITGLNGNTSYDFYVRSNCGSNDTSSYAGPLSFTTFPDTAQGVACSASNNSSILFSEEFDNNNAGWTGDINSGNESWEIPDGSTSSNTGADNAYSGSSYMNYEASSTSANSGSITSPAIDLSTAADDAELSFWMHAYGASMGTLEIGVGTSSSGPFTTEFTWTGPLQTSGSDAWVNVGVDLSSYLGQTIYIQLTQHDTLNNLGSGFDGDMSID